MNKKLKLSALHRYRSERKLIIIAVTFLVLFLIIFLLFAKELVLHKLNGFDVTVTHWIQSWIDPENTSIMKFFTVIGSPVVIAVLTLISVIFLYWTGKRWEALGMVVANVGGVGFNEVLKWLFHRQRPDIHRLITAHGYSFPSGHAMGSVVFYGMLTYFTCLFAQCTLSKILMIITSAVLILMISVSRIYLGVHYPSDVIAGFAAGGVWVIVCSLVLSFIVQRRSR